MKTACWIICVFCLAATRSYSQVDTKNPPRSGGDTILIAPDTRIQYDLPPKPKHAWELGLHGGHFFIAGDVDHSLPAGFGTGLHLRKAINYTFSVRMNLFYGQAKGLDPQPSASNLMPEQHVFLGYGPDNPWFFAYKTRYIFGSLEGMVNIGNILFHQRPHKWNIYAGIGLGVDNHKAMLDLRDENGNLYTNLVTESGYTEDLLDTRSGRRQIKDALRDVYDGDYETEGPRQQGIFRLGDETNVHALFTASVGVARKLSRRVNLGLEHQLLLSDNDYLDGQKWRTEFDQSNSVDVGHYTSLRLAINLGNLDKRSEPLYWVNPVDVAFQSIKKLEFQVIDSDCDGVPDEFDLMTTDCNDVCLPVDSKGRPLDSDRDGIADCRDCEPYSPPGLPVNNCGKVIQITDKPSLDTAALVNYIKEQCPLCEIPDRCDGDWFLPRIHFDLDRYEIKPEFYAHLFHVANAMRECPELCLIVNGYTDNRHSNNYNLRLSYDRANAVIEHLVAGFNISRDRLILRYGGEEQPIIRDLPDRRVSQALEQQHYINRRVEFSICECSVSDCPEEMEPPRN